MAFLIANFISVTLSSRWQLLSSWAECLFVSIYLVEVDQRLFQVETGQVKHAEITQELMKKGFNKINEATELFGQLEASALRTDMMTQLVRHSTQHRRQGVTAHFPLRSGRDSAAVQTAA